LQQAPQAEEKECLDVHINGDSKLEKCMANVHALKQMWDRNGQVLAAVQRMQDEAKEMSDDLLKLRVGCDDMRLQMEDGVALVCAMLGVHAVKHW
jgi:hypothetical protein